MKNHNFEALENDIEKLLVKHNIDGIHIVPISVNGELTKVQNIGLMHPNGGELVYKFIEALSVLYDEELSDIIANSTCANKKPI